MSLRHEKPVPCARRRMPGVSSLLWRSPAGMAGMACMVDTSLKLESGVMDVRSAKLASALGFAVGKGALRARMAVAVMEAADCN